MYGFSAITRTCSWVNIFRAMCDAPFYWLHFITQLCPLRQDREIDRADAPKGNESHSLKGQKAACKTATGQAEIRNCLSTSRGSMGSTPSCVGLTEARPGGKWIGPFSLCETTSWLGSSTTAWRIGMDGPWPGPQGRFSWPCGQFTFCATRSMRMSTPQPTSSPLRG